MKKYKDITEYTKKEMSGESSGHDWFHIQRVLNNALHINETEQGDQEIVYLGALLHDLGDPKLSGKEETRTSIPQKVMQQHGIYDEVQNKVLEIIANMSFSTNLDGKKELSKEGQIVQDADRLDGMGAIGVARCFAYGGAKNRDMWNPEQEVQEFSNKESYHASEGNSLNHFEEKLFKLKEDFNTQTGKEIAEERDQFLHEFYNRFKDEWYGKR